MSDQVHATGPMYRPSRDEEHGIDAGTKRILYMMGAGGLVILAGIAAYSLTGRSGGGPVPVVQADQSPMRVDRENPGGMAVGPEAKRADPNNSHLRREPRNPILARSWRLPARGRDRVSRVHCRPGAFEAGHRATYGGEDRSAGATSWETLAKKMPDLFGQHRALYRRPMSLDRHRGGCAPVGC